MQAVLMLTFPVALTPVALAYLARYAFGSEWAFFGVLLSSSTHVPSIDLRAEESINWSREAEERMERVPPLVKGIARTAILRFAMERGHSVVTSDVIEQAMEAFMPGYTGRMMGKVAKVLAIEKVRDDRQLTYICEVCGYTAKTENPARCPVCQATAEHFQVIDRQVVEAIAAAEGTTWRKRRLMAAS
jgi:hypothetical protein